jgi:hypothetical protein
MEILSDLELFCIGQYGHVTVSVRDASERYKSTVVHQIGAAEGNWMSNGVETPLPPPGSPQPPMRPRKRLRKSVQNGISNEFGILLWG